MSQPQAKSSGRPPAEEETSHGNAVWFDPTRRARLTHFAGSLGLQGQESGVKPASPPSPTGHELCAAADAGSAMGERWSEVESASRSLAGWLAGWLATVVERWDGG